MGEAAVLWIHQVWLQGGDVPSEVEDSAASWRAHHPTARYTRWSERDILADLADDPEMLAFYVRAPQWVARVDLAKYALLFRHGGVYADADTRCLRPLDHLVAGSSPDTLLVSACDPSMQGFLIRRVFGLAPRQALVNNGVLVAAAPRNPVLGALLARASREWPRDAQAAATMTGVQVLGLVGPPSLTRAVHARAARAHVRVLPFEAFEGPDDPGADPAPTGAFDAYAAHLHARSWLPGFPDLEHLEKLDAQLARPMAAGCVAATAVVVSFAALQSLRTRSRRVRANLAAVAVIFALALAAAVYWVAPVVSRAYLERRFRPRTLRLGSGKNDASEGDADADAEAPPYVLSPARFAFLAPLQRAWPAIAEDARRALSRAPVVDGVSRKYDEWTGDDDFFARHLDVHGWVRAWTPGDARAANPDWLNYGLMYAGRPFPANAALCPSVSALLAPIADRINICGFSWMRPLSCIPSHVDSTGARFGSMAFHLGLLVPDVVPGACKLVVGDVAVFEEAGRAIVFDSSFAHHAENNASEDRVILYIDFKT
jgi:hypothetical protein